MRQQKNIRVFATTAAELEKAMEMMKEAWTVVLVIPSMDVIKDMGGLDAFRISINVMSKADYVAASNWHVDAIIG